MIYPLSILATVAFALVASFGAFDSSRELTSFMGDPIIANTTPDLVIFLTVIAIVWSVLGLCIFLISSLNMAEYLAKLHNNDQFVEAARARAENLMASAKELTPLFNDVSPSLLANEDEPISSMVKSIAHAEKSLQKAKNKQAKAKVNVESFKTGPLSLIYKMYVK